MRGRYPHPASDDDNGTEKLDMSGPPQRADEIAQAMQARGYRSDRTRTCYLRSHFGHREWLFSVGAGLFVVLVFGVTR